MSSSQRINDELEAKQACFDLRAYAKPVMNNTLATSDCDWRESAGRIDQSASTPAAASTRLHEIRIDKNHRVLVSTTSRDGLFIIIGALIASCGLAWILISALASPLTWAFTSGDQRFLNSNTISSRQHDKALDALPRAIDSPKRDHLQDHDAIASALETPTGAPDSTNLSSSLTKSLGAAPPVASANKQAMTAQPHTTSNGARRHHQMRPKRTIVPETRPKTIKGWTVREVINGTVVLEGSNGVWKAASGSTVPGLGRVNSIVRWGNRWIVATSSGLISTP